MKVAILTLGSRGDVQPYVALGRGLQAAGHDVVLATAAQFEPFAQLPLPSHGDVRVRHGNELVIQNDLFHEISWVAPGWSDYEPLPAAISLSRC